jgi:hypothetical protein
MRTPWVVAGLVLVVVGLGIFAVGAKERQAATHRHLESEVEEATRRLIFLDEKCELLASTSKLTEGIIGSKLDVDDATKVVDLDAERRRPLPEIADLKLWSATTLRYCERVVDPNDGGYIVAGPVHQQAIDALRAKLGTTEWGPAYERGRVAAEREKEHRKVQ